MKRKYRIEELPAGAEVDFGGFAEWCRGTEGYDQYVSDGKREKRVGKPVHLSKQTRDMVKEAIKCIRAHLGAAGKGSGG